MKIYEHWSIIFLCGYCFVFAARLKKFARLFVYFLKQSNFEENKKNYKAF